jgi:hypothetical protein
MANSNNSFDWMAYPFDHRKSPVMDLKRVIATSNENRYVVSEKSTQA